MAVVARAIHECDTDELISLQTQYCENVDSSYQ